jgi:Tol biopolymer transport system component
LIGGPYGLYKRYGSVEKKVNIPFQRIDVTKLTINGSALYAAISGDGKYVAYTKSEGGKESLWLRQVGNAGTIEIVPPREGRFGGIIFSPDGGFIYYAYANAESPNDMTVFRVPTLGTGATAVKVSLEDGPASLSHDGKRIAYLRFDPDQKADLLKIANADGTNQRIVATRRWPSRFSYDYVTRPTWTSDDQGLAMPVFKNEGGGYFISIVEIRLADGSEITIPLSPQRFEQPYHMTLLPDSSGVVLSAKAHAASFSQIWLLGRDGTARTLTNDLSDYHDADLSRDSNALVTVQSQVLSNVFVTNKSIPNDRGQITSGVGRYFDLTWAPDGKILYASDASGDANIYEVSGDGSSTRQLTSGMKRNYAPSVSPDNRYIVFHSNRSGNFQVWRMDRDGNNPIQLTQGNSESNWPRFSPDSKWVFYEHFEPGVQGSVWKVPVGGGTPMKMTDGFTTRPTLSPDGKWLAYWYNENKPNSRWQLQLLAIADGKIAKTFEVPASVGVRWDTTVVWTADSKSLSYVDRRAGIENLWAQSIDGGAPKQITNFTDNRIFSFDWSRDGKLVTSRGVITSDVVLITDATR